MTKNIIHMTGIGGIGMSALAQLLLERGDVVSGSDRAGSPVTDLLVRRGIMVSIGQRAENVPDNATLLIYSSAVPADNPERLRAKELGIPELTYFEMLGEVSKNRRTIAIAGTNGKTTTTSMLARIMVDAALSPTVVVGSIITDFGSNYLHGDSNLFVVEACEYERHFLTLSPEILVITNVEFDHTDYFRDLADVQSAFRSLMEKVPAHGAIITDPKHPAIAPLLSALAAPIIDYTSEPHFELMVPGEFNVMNARAAAAAARAAAPTLSGEAVATSLSHFTGTWRRFEYKGVTEEGVEVFDDYAHHPTAIRETLHALRQKRAKEGKQGHVIAAFHPHLYSRTRDLLEDFSRAFTDADEVIIAPIFAAREVDDGTISSNILAERIQSEGVHARAAASLSEAEEMIRACAHRGDTIMTMGAGDIYTVADNLVAHMKQTVSVPQPS